MKGWWSGGFGYGLWIGVLVASGFSVVPVPSMKWKNDLELTGGRCSKVCVFFISHCSDYFPNLSKVVSKFLIIFQEIS